RAGVRKLNRVGDEIVEYLVDSSLIKRQLRQCVLDVKTDANLFSSRQLGVETNAALEQLVQVRRAAVQRQIARLDRRHVQEVIDQLHHEFARIPDARKDSKLFWSQDSGHLVGQKLGEREDAADGVSQ